MTRKIILTGGGTAGHVTPNIALMDPLRKAGFSMEYIGSPDGIEKGMMSRLDVPYHAVRSGKLRRYFSWKNLLEPFNVLIGIVQAALLIRALKPVIVFSKGGFVSFPVVVGAWLNRVPVVAHESDMTPGLANRLSYPFVDTICVTFTAAKSQFKHQSKVVVTGTPIRQALFEGDRLRGLVRCGFNEKKPCLLIMGGSQGSRIINQCVREALTVLCEQFQVIHLCGEGNVDTALQSRPDYYQVAYANDDMADLLAASDLVISRAGANSLYELLALSKPHVLIPLSYSSSRGDQVQNAAYFKAQGISVVVDEADLTQQTLCAAIEEVQSHKSDILARIKALHIESAALKIVSLIEKTLETAA